MGVRSITEYAIARLTRHNYACGFAIERAASVTTFPHVRFRPNLSASDQPQPSNRQIKPTPPRTSASSRTTAHHLHQLRKSKPPLTTSAIVRFAERTHFVSRKSFAASQHTARDSSQLMSPEGLALHRSIPPPGERKGFRRNRRGFFGKRGGNRRKLKEIGGANRPLPLELTSPAAGRIPDCGMLMHVWPWVSGRFDHLYRIHEKAMNGRALRATCVLRSLSGIAPACAAALALAFASPGIAATISWNNAGGGSFQDSANWNPATVPGASDTVVFATPGVTSDYQVTFASNAANQQLNVSSRSVHFDLGTHLYTLSTTAQPSVNVGVTGATSQLFITHGALISADAAIGGTLGNGVVTVDAANWSSTGMISLGTASAPNAGGTGALNIINGAQVTSNGGTLGRGVGTGNAAVSDFSQWLISGDLFLGGGPTAAGGNGHITIGVGSLVDVSGHAKLWPSGNLSIDHGVFNARNLTLARGRLSGAGIVNADVDASGTVYSVDLTLSGAFDMTDETTLIAAITDTKTSTHFNVNNDVELDGELMVQLAQNLAPELKPSDAYTIFTAYSFTGGFDNVVDGRVATSGGEGSFQVNYLQDGVELSNFRPGSLPSIPLPAGVWTGLVTLGLCGVYAGVSSLRRRLRGPGVEAMKHVRGH